MGLSEIQKRARTAADAAGRNPGDVTLIAVSKVQPLERVKTILDQGHRAFGENRVQEAAGKWPDFRENYDGVDLHLIGPLQTNKTRQAMELFQAIHTVDRPKLARTIARIAGEIGTCPDIFVQVNTGGEDQKAGCALGDTDALVALCRELKLPLIGLMCIPPVDEPPGPHFATLAEIAERNGVVGLSMGMSSDFEVAIAHGATHIRVGSAIFGDRDYD
jgi:hypothetical protein